MIPQPDLVGWELERARRTLAERDLPLEVALTAPPPRPSDRPRPSGPLRVIRQRWVSGVALLVCAPSVVLAADLRP